MGRHELETKQRARATPLLLARGAQYSSLAVDLRSCEILLTIVGGTKGKH